MPSLSEYTESGLRSRYNNYWKNSLSISDNRTFKIVSYDLEKQEHRGLWSSAWIGGGDLKRDPRKVFFDLSSGDYLGTTADEAAREAIRRGIRKFVNFDFSGAREQFDSAYFNSSNQSSEEAEAKRLKDITDKVLTGLSSFNSGNYSDTRSQLSSAYSDASGEMAAAIGRKRNELSESLNRSALDKFELGEWARAEELFSEAYLICQNNYSNEAAFKQSRDVAAKMKTINSSNEIGVLNEALSLTQNERMKQAIARRLRDAQANRKSAQEREDIERAINAFANQQFTTARDIFRSVYNSSASGSDNETRSNKYLDIANKVLTATDDINGGDYSTWRGTISLAYRTVDNGRMRSAIGERGNELAETVNERALRAFEQGQWAQARELFNEAYYLCVSDYRNEAEFERSKKVAEKLESMNASNQVVLLTEALNSTQNSRMRLAVTTKLSTAKSTAARLNFTQGMRDWNEAWEAELDESADRSDEASRKFAAARGLFEAASQLEPLTASYRNWLSACSLKIAGNSDFNQGFQLQVEGKRLQQQAKYPEARSKYEQARGKFEEGLRKSGDLRFQSSIDIAREKIDEIDGIVRSSQLGGITVRPVTGGGGVDDGTNRPVETDQTVEHG